MKQLLQDARTGEIQVAEVPAPRLLPGCVLVQGAASVLSSGTERAAAAFASKSLLQKAVARPDLVRELIAKVRRDGIFSAMQVARSRLDQPVALGYSSAGTVIAVADEITDIRPGDRVACAGAGYAVHAEFASVPRLLIAKIPSRSQISFEEAAFTTLGAVALHGIRTAEVKLGDVVAVIGLGLLGQLTVQLLKAAGCRVLGIDLMQQRADVALSLAADRATASRESFADLCREETHGQGADCIIITADSESSDPVNLAAKVARDRAKVVAVGAIGMEIDRRLYYAKELDFRVSRSYGPGRYDSAYEQQGRDYPIGYVRWTETRNMEAFLELVADGKIKLQPLITHRFSLESAEAAYDLITDKTARGSLGVVLTYAAENSPATAFDLPRAPGGKTDSKPSLSLIGAGNFATSTLLPALQKIDGSNLRGICSLSGLHAHHAAKRFGFQYCTTDEGQLIGDAQCDAIIIATRHHLHASQIIAAIRAGKHVFCEKPLCIHEPDLAEIVHEYLIASPQRVLAVGFNRRFAPLTRQLKSFFSAIHEPLALHYRVNGGSLPPDHWLNDPHQGGGRILGELCHFVDVLIFLTGCNPVKVYGRSLPQTRVDSGESVSVLIEFENGSQATINYLTNGDRAFSKERLEVFGGGSAAVLENFRSLELVQHGRKRVMRSHWRQDKGHKAELCAFLDAIKDPTKMPIPLLDIIATTLTTFAVKNSLSTGQPVEVNVSGFLRSVATAQTATSVPA